MKQAFFFSKFESVVDFLTGKFDNFGDYQNY